MRSLASSLLLLCSLLLVLGCPKKDEPDPIDQPDASATDGGIAGEDAGEPDPHRPATAAEYDTFWDEAANVYCERMSACGLIEEAKVAQCRSTMMLEASSAQTRASITAGYRVFYVDNAARCLAALKDLQCTNASFEALEDACDGIEEGAQGKDEPCYDYGDCQGDLMCSGSGCERTCTDHYGTVAPGGACQSSSCDETLGYCGQNGTCVAWLADGADCSGSAGLCNTASLFCDPDTALCRARLASGAACGVYYYGECADGLYCKPNTANSEDGTCASKPSEGGSCTSSSDCGTVTVDGEEHSLFCSMSGTCMRYSVELGESCGEEQSCYDGYCQGATSSAPGTCVASIYSAVNEPCSTTEPYQKLCQLGLTCDEQSGTCKLLSEAGGDCSRGRDCQMLLECVEGTCTAPAALGETCGEAGCAAPNHCDQATSKCVAPLANSAACQDDFECSSGNCAEHLCAEACGS